MIIISDKVFKPGLSGELYENTAVIVSHGIILAVGRADLIIRKYPSHRITLLKNAVLMPGLVNLHSHLELPPLLKTIRAESFPEWVLNLIKQKKKLSPQDYKNATSANLRTLIETGTTTVGEICSHGVSRSFLKNFGLRAVVFHEIINMMPETENEHPGNLLAGKRDLALIKFGLSPHTPYTVSERVLRHIIALSKKRHLRLAMHIAESEDEARLLQGTKSGLEKLYKVARWDLSRAPKGSSSFEYLNRIGFLTPNVLAVHAVQATDEDIELVKKSKLCIAHCPRSNKETGVGRMPLKKFLNAGVSVGLGTDSLASSPSLNMWDEMRFALKIHKRDGITAKDIFSLATMGGAKALGLDKEIGTLEPGKRADIIAVPLPSKNQGDIYSDLIRETKSCIMTMVNGKIIWKDKRDPGF